MSAGALATTGGPQLAGSIDLESRHPYSADRAQRNEAMNQMGKALMQTFSQKYDLASWILEGQIRPEECLNHFAPGIYCREIRIKAVKPHGTIILGHRHKTRHLCVMVKGRMRAIVDGEVREIRAGDVFVADPDEHKLALVIEDTQFLNIHPNPDDCTDMQVLERELVGKCQAYLEYEADIERLRKEIS